MAAKHPWQSLIGSLSESGYALHHALITHPASTFLNVSLIYNRSYHESQESSDNLYYSRCRAGLLTLAALDEVARVLKLVPQDKEPSILPDQSLRDLIVSLGYHPDSKMMQKLVIDVRSPNGVRIKKSDRKKQLKEVISNPVPKEEIETNKDFNNLVFNFVKGKS